MFSAPALTPGGKNHNPGLRVFTYNKKSGTILQVIWSLNYCYHCCSKANFNDKIRWKMPSLYQMTQYYLNLSSTIEHDLPNWQFEYNFTTLYNVTDLSAKSISMVTALLADPTSRTFVDYFFSYSVLYNTSVDQCIFTCSQNMYCAVDTLDYEAHDACMSMMDYSVTPQIAICFRDDEPGIVHRDSFHGWAWGLWGWFVLALLVLGVVIGIIVYTGFFYGTRRKVNKPHYVLL